MVKGKRKEDGGCTCPLQEVSTDPVLVTAECKPLRARGNREGKMAVIIHCSYNKNAGSV
jgi:hypothetical protein